MREGRTVVVLAAPDGDVGLPTIADPIFLINGAFCHDGGYQKVARANREGVISGRRTFALMDIKMGAWTFAAVLPRGAELLSSWLI